jgi:hypothetical protein
VALASRHLTQLATTMNVMAHLAKGCACGGSNTTKHILSETWKSNLTTGVEMKPPQREAGGSQAQFRGSLERDSGAVTASNASLKLSPSGRKECGVKSAVKLRDAESGALQQKLDGYGNYVTAVPFSPDGRKLLDISGQQRLCTYPNDNLVQWTMVLNTVP